MMIFTMKRTEKNIIIADGIEDSGERRTVESSLTNSRKRCLDVSSMCVNGVLKSGKEIRIDCDGFYHEALFEEEAKTFGVLLTDEREAAKSSHGIASVMGRRREMEDTVAIGEISPYDFFGVYDGHNGACVAAMCRERMYQLVREELMTRAASGGQETNWDQLMALCFKRMEEEVSRDDEVTMVGSTALVVMVGTEVVVAANCGDSRVVLGRSGEVLSLSRDHKPDSPEEKERIEAAGGRVLEWGGSRVEGVLATSRSIGDKYLKPYVSSEPDVTVTKRSDGDDFLIIATDGLWDVISSEDACMVGSRCLNGQTRRRLTEQFGGGCKVADTVAVLLVELALARGSKDNISVVIVELNKERS